jgi:hypothetical protein
VKPKKAEDEQDDDHKADEIDDAVHGVVTSGATIQRRIVRVQTKGLEKLVAFQNVPKLSRQEGPAIGSATHLAWRV